MTQIAAIRLAPAEERGTPKWAAEGDVTANSLAVKKKKNKKNEARPNGLPEAHITWPLHCNNATKKLRNKERYA